MLLKAVILADDAPVPPFATGNVAVQDATPPVVEVRTDPAVPGVAVGSVSVQAAVALDDDCIDVGNAPTFVFASVNTPAVVL